MASAGELFDFHQPDPPQEVQRDPLYVAVDFERIELLDTAFDQMDGLGCSFLLYPLVNSTAKRDLLKDPEQEVPFVYYSEKFFNTSPWINKVVGKISPWIELDSSDDQLRVLSELAFKQEAAWSSHLSLPALVTPEPLSLQCSNMARVFNQLLSTPSYLHLWVPIPVSYDVRSDNLEEKDPTELIEEGADLSWRTWDQLRTLCDHNANLSVVLIFSSDLPSFKHFQRWLSEPVKAVILPSEIFLTNSIGQPFLSNEHRRCLLHLLEIGVQLILRGFSDTPGQLYAKREYLNQMYNNSPPLSQQEAFEKPFRDYLQSPLQPLMDNLQSATYETFERDPVKYNLYEQALTLAFQEEIPADKEAVVMVVGAGRGPLVNCSLRAAATTRRRIRVFAVEKNPNAVVTLKAMKASRWGDRVTIVATDMRKWQPHEKADVLVSELLGSFGDNELSPECLDGAQRFLKDGGVMIPQSYTSFIAPVAAQKLWLEAKGVNPNEEQKQLETAYVVKFHSFHQLASSKPCFTFSHPSPDFEEPPEHNSRYSIMKFDCPLAETIHGFAGYFEAVLYGSVLLSINPQTFSKGMFSWFPLYFPLRHPLSIDSDSVVEVHFWRNVSTRTNKAWYEWCISSPGSTAIHNVNGRSYHVGL